MGRASLAANGYDALVTDPHLPSCSVCGKTGPDLAVFEDGIRHEDGSVEVLGTERMYRCAAHMPTPGETPAPDGGGDDLMPHERGRT